MLWNRIPKHFFLYFCEKIVDKPKFINDETLIGKTNSE